MEDDTAVAKAFIALARNFIAGGLRKEFPYMELSAVKETACRAAEEIAKGLEKAKPQMRASKSKSGFFSLPPEIRNDIYHLILLSDQRKPQVEFREPKKTGFKLKNPVCANFAFPKLLHASRQIRNEAMPILLSKLEVEITAILYMRGPGVAEARCDEDQMPLSKTWIAGLGKEMAKTIKVVRLQVDELRFQRRKRVPEGLELRGTNDEVWGDLGFNGLGLQRKNMKIFEYVQIDDRYYQVVERTDELTEAEEGSPIDS